MLLVPGVVAIAVVPELVLYLGHDDGPPHPRLGLPLEVSHPGQQLLQVGLGPLLDTGQYYAWGNKTNYFRLRKVLL